MKNLTLLLSVLMMFSMTLLKAQAPPYKICFDYDVAGNRIAQKPAWLGQFSPMPPDPGAYFDPDCQCNDPENTKSDFGNKVIRIRHWSDLNWLIERISVVNADISWVLPYKKVPIGVWEGKPVLSPELVGSDFVLTGGVSYGVVVMEDDVFSTGKDKDDVKKYDATIIPNPNNGKFKIAQFGFELDKTKISIMNSQGALLFNRDFVDGNVSVGEFANGLYILILSDGVNTKSMKFVKE